MWGRSPPAFCRVNKRASMNQQTLWISNNKSDKSLRQFPYEHPIIPHKRPTRMYSLWRTVISCAPSSRRQSPIISIGSKHQHPVFGVLHQHIFFALITIQTFRYGFRQRCSWPSHVRESCRLLPDCEATFKAESIQRQFEGSKVGQMAS